MAKSEYNTTVDTMNVTTEISNIGAYNDITGGLFDYAEITGSKIIGSELNVDVKINLHNRYGQLSFKNSDEYNRKLVETLKTLGYNDLSKVKLNRVDIATDTNMLTFKDNFKALLYVFELLTIKYKRDSRWYVTNLNTLKQNSIKLYGSRFELEIYDKALTTNGVHPYETRLEFRYKRESNDVTQSVKYVDKTLDKVNEMVNAIEIVNDNMVKRLKALYDMEIEKGTIKSFSEFCRKYGNYIYTTDILKELYKYSGLKGSYKIWLDKFRKNNNMEFFSKSQVKTIQSQLKKSIKEWK